MQRDVPRQTGLFLEDCGYRRLSNPLDKRGQWMIGGQRINGVYVNKKLTEREAIAAAEAIRVDL